MKLGLDGRVCLVTGASSGIGRASAMVLAEEGARLVLSARSSEGLAAVAAAIAKTGAPEPLAIVADLAAGEGAAALVADVLAQAGHVDVLVNNAGGSRPMGDPDDVALWAESFQLNFTSARRLGELLLPGMAARGWGRVINVTGAIVAKTFNAASPAKAALESWSKAAAATYAARGVTVNCLAPGRLSTRQILERLHPTEEARRAYIEANIPAGRFGRAEDAADLIAFLASDRAGYITGTTIPVDGGAMRLAF